MRRCGWFVLAAAMLGLTGCGTWSGRTPEDSFRMLTYNIHHGESRKRVLDIAAAAKVAARQKARFVFLQEVDQGTRRVAGADTCAVFSRVCGLTATFARAIGYQGGDYGVALLSATKPLTVRRYPLPGVEPRVLLLCEFPDCWAGTMHLDWQSTAAQQNSIDIIRRALAACGGDKPVFLAGDWNATPDSATLSELKHFLTVLTPQDRATFGQYGPVSAQAKCIDYIAVDAAHTAAWTVRSGEVLDVPEISDHFPVCVAVESVRSAAR